MVQNRRAALEGLLRILDAPAPEDLFTGAEDEARFLYDLLAEATRGRGSEYYGEICRTARRRGLTPEYVVDRAAVLHAAMTERRRTDLYRILGVPPLASEEMIRQRWLEVAKRHHPDVGGDVETFRHAKQAFEILRDPHRRREYERFWLRALGPFERVVPRDEGPGIGAVHARARRPAALVHARVCDAEDAVVAWKPRAVTARGAPPPQVRAEEREAGGRRGAFAAAARVLAAREALDRRLAAGPLAAARGLTGLLARLEAVVAPLGREELDTLAADLGRMIRDLETMQAQLAVIATLKRRIGG
jgi:hypothetical protein